MKKPLWQPTELKKKNSILADFAKFINFKSEYKTSIYYQKFNFNSEYRKSIYWKKIKSNGSIGRGPGPEHQETGLVSYI